MPCDVPLPLNLYYKESVMPQSFALTDNRSPRPVRQRTRAARSSELQISIATTREEVASAWNLVYRSYRQAQLIDDNPYQIHTVPHALRPGTSVILGRIDGELVSTLTIMHDGREGLPLDRVYKPRLNQLREEGRRLMEVGLFADRRLSISQATTSFMEMMRFVFYSSCYSLADIMIGVHPSHAPFYERNFGFVVDGPVDVHPLVNCRPVVLLRGDTQAQLRADPVPRQLVDYVNRPLPRTAFEDRARLHPETVAGTVIASFVERLHDFWSEVYQPSVAEARIA